MCLGQMWLLNPNTVFEDTVLGIVKQTTLTTTRPRLRAQARHTTRNNKHDSGNLTSLDCHNERVLTASEVVTNEKLETTRKITSCKTNYRKINGEVVNGSVVG